MLEFFDDAEIRTVSYIPITFTDDPSSGQQQRTEGTAEAMYGLLWDRSEAARYFGQQISSDVSTYLVVEDIGNIEKTGLIRYAGIDYEIETIQNVAYMDETYLVGLRIHR